MVFTTRSSVACAQIILCAAVLLLISTAAKAFEVSYWVDIDAKLGNGRGYWYHYQNVSADTTPTNAQVWGVCSRTRYTYHANKLYVIYHRQFEIANAESVFTLWKNNGPGMGLDIVPTLVLQDYDTSGGGYGSNFSSSELTSLVTWLKNNINTEIAIYDIYGNRQGSGSVQDGMLTTIQNVGGMTIERIGLQPGETTNSKFSRAVEDAWGAECEGKTNDYYSNPRYYQGTYNWGKNQLQSWVNARISSDSIPVAWDLIPVAWNYNACSDPYGYLFPGDNQATNMNPPSGRAALCASDAVACYSGGGGNSKFGGYSCDLHILEANSDGHGDSPDFYAQITNDQAYTGYFASGLNDVEAVYALYN